MRWWRTLVLVVCGAKLVVYALVVGALPATDATAGSRLLIHFAIVVVFAGAGAFLLWGGRRDQRAGHLAVAYALVAASFTIATTLRFAEGAQQLGGVIQLLAYLQVEAFLPYFVWRFVHEFPKSTSFGARNRLPLGMARVSLAAGAALLVANLAFYYWSETQPNSNITIALGWFSRPSLSSFYWPVLLLLVTPAMPAMLWKAKNAPVDERHRVSLLVLGLVFGSLPILTVVVLMGLVPPFAQFIREPRTFAISQAIIYPALLSIPATTSYAVLVNQALDIRIVVRRAIRYAFARYTVFAAAAIPLLLFSTIVIANRGETITDLATGGEGIILLALGALGIAAVWLRRPILDYVDRRFFREQYDVRRIFRGLVEGARSVSSVMELDQLVRTELDRALHVDTVGLLYADRVSGQLVDPAGRMRPLGLNSELVRTLNDTGIPFCIDLDRENRKIPELVPADLDWLADGGFRLLMPILGSDDRVVGLIALGDKRSELPYTQEDRALISTLAASTAITLEDRLLAKLPADRPIREETSAAACTDERCGKLGPVGISSCPTCTAEMSPAAVPLVLAGKFRLEQRIGEGGWGVVFRGVDIELDRQVAIKTMPKLGAQLGWRLRREARAMAAVSHPNLATIFGLESWNGVPMLVCEYLAGGTLRDRLDPDSGGGRSSLRGEVPWDRRAKPGARRLDAATVVHLGVMLAHAVEGLHSAGILHRDIKPSNVGFTAEGTPKLLDFGLARFVEASSDAARKEGASGGGVGTSNEMTTYPGESTVGTGSGLLVGTLAYMSPEAIAGEEPGPLFDLWSLAVLLYESLTGTNPFLRNSVAETLMAIDECELDDLADWNVPEPLADIIHKSLSRNRKIRPSSARALGRELGSIQMSAART